ncbi:hypothetical protein PVL29_012977 [Vitis rotundifolia]|uniref:Uncharacterized protein n=1 Tax=Vitis rotundifolia TaxID=103349 RepID=A0AA39DMW3_VITRO|nr:hypothetical protein PVL29_012977 [Vitis rotundifolia]
MSNISYNSMLLHCSLFGHILGPSLDHSCITLDMDMYLVAHIHQPAACLILSGSLMLTPSSGNASCKMLTHVEELAWATMKKLTQRMAEHIKAMAAAKSDEAKDNIKTQKQNTTTGLRTCNNILAMTQPLHSKSPSFIGDKRINLSWKEATKRSVPSGKRSASTTNGASNAAAKKGGGAGGLQSQLVNRALEGLSRGGRTGMRGRGKGWGGRGRGRSYS